MQQIIEYDHYTDIPDDVRGFLEEKLGGYQKDEGQVHFDYQRAKQNILFYLTTYITYEENVLPITGGDFALTFLDGTQSGYDVHYATAAALMFRYYGIPARYVEGYLVTKDDAAQMKSGQTLNVGGNRAHAWVEYYQDGLGWLPFEATPTYFSAMEKVDTSGSPYVEVYMEQLKTAQARIPCSSWPTIETILNTAFESVLRGQASSQEALDDAAAQIDALLAQE